MDFFEKIAGQAGIVLNEAQRAAASHAEGPLLLLASPGSGKTTTLLARIAYLMVEKGVPAGRIKAVTFSKAAAEDMKTRFAKLFPASGPEAPAFSTIHSLAFEIVREHFRRRGIAYRIIESRAGDDDADRPGKAKIVRELYRRENGDYPTDERMEELTRYIGFVKNKLVPPDKLSEVKCDVPKAEAIFRAYEHYKRSREERLLIDYDDMLTIANEVLAEDADLLLKYQRRYDYVMTDESQDTSRVQHEIVDKLVRAHGNLWVVADDDQSIYGWRAADPGYLLDFKKNHPNAVILLLERNYRSTPDIVDIANRFIKRNRSRYDKNMFTCNPPGEPIAITVLPDHRYQAKYVAEKILDEGEPGETAVLYRNNSSSILLMNTLDRAGIPFWIKDGETRFFSHWVVEDVLNFMRLTFNDRRPDILEKIHLKFNGYVSKKQMEQLLRLEADPDESVFDRLLKHIPLREYQTKALVACKLTFRGMRGASPLEVIRTVRDKLGYDKSLEKSCERMGYRKETLAGILNALEEIAEPLGTMEEFAARLKFLEGRMKQAKSVKREGAVTLSTLHSAKGLEFSRVFIVDLAEGVLPSADDVRKWENGDREEMEEAARLFYVGMTRAKRKLELLSYARKEGEAAQPSRFVEEVRGLQRSAGHTAGAGHAEPGSAGSVGKAASGQARPAKRAALPRTPAANPNAIRDPAKLVVGARVRHGAFGDGEIVLVIGDSLEIRFEAGTKRLSANVCMQMGLLELVASSRS
ncbi:ATP-dependent helicase [Paenibacillaceae bacterium WGS1546]|uniref:ATP-dependent helicase n=1 Tax=Cohnella sp. WGS1546 TaxID=3366810 RepID=UPI00372D43EE